MKFRTHFNFKSVPEKLSSSVCELFDDSGFIPLDIQIKNLVQAGEQLESSRRASFPGFEDSEIDVDDIDIDDLDHIDREALIKRSASQMRNYTAKVKSNDLANPGASGEELEKGKDNTIQPEAEKSEK